MSFGQPLFSKAATLTDETNLPQSPKPHAICSSGLRDAKAVALRFKGNQYPAVLEPILSHYSRNLVFRFKEESRYTEHEVDWEGVDEPTFALWHDLIQQHYWGGQCQSIRKMVSCNDVDTLSVLAKLADLCKKAESPAIGSWAKQEFHRQVDRMTTQWDTEANQDKTHDGLQRAFLTWEDKDCKTRIVTKFNKTLDDKVFERLSDTMDPEFYFAASKDRLKTLTQENTELKHKLSNIVKVEPTPSSANVALPYGFHPGGFSSAGTSSQPPCESEPQSYSAANATVGGGIFRGSASLFGAAKKTNYLAKT
ncbi:hypothetical protein JX265_007702 [Neoarthrinium moseri]|uniref:Uncharacterized protein n=1 Tax=Neoarthrinium moseri TaxID=1658444 RepID=A0A9P9WJ41_9PEZI|nr:hypothetical protein JX265_007702 [Neoarthrinium moseri]